MSIPHSYTAHITLRGTFFTGDEPKYNFQDAQKLADEKRPSHADFSGRKPFKKYDEQFTPSTSNTVSSFSRHCGNYESADNASGISPQEGKLCADALYGPGGDANIYLGTGISGIERQKQNF